jgi:Family of unknown function (DUF6415)
MTTTAAEVWREVTFPVERAQMHEPDFLARIATGLRASRDRDRIALDSVEDDLETVLGDQPTPEELGPIAERLREASIQLLPRLQQHDGTYPAPALETVARVHALRGQGLPPDRPGALGVLRRLALATLSVLDLLGEEPQHGHR